MIRDNIKKVRVVLIHPPLHNVLSAATPGYVDRNRGHTPPMGLLYIQAAVEQSGHESTFLDADLEGWDHHETARQALSYNPDLIGLQAMTFTLKDAYLVAQAIKRLSPETQVMIGGPHATIYPRETVELEAVDYALAGEAELSFISFLDAFSDPASRASVPGIACRIEGQTSFTPSCGLLKDLDLVAIPARHSSPYQRYSSVLAGRSPITIMITSRGCPFSCIFCNRMGRKYRCHSSDYVLREIESILSLGINDVFIHDDTFTINRERVAAICEGIIARKYDLVWEARTRVDCVDEQLLALMRKAGCRRLSFGVESGSERVLKNMRKGIDLDKVRKVFAWSKREGIVTLADFMFGNLGEEREDIDKTLALMKELGPDYAQFSICSPYPATPLYEIALERGIIPFDIWKEFSRNPLMDIEGPMWTENFSPEELRQITAAAYRKFYLKPAFVLKQFMKINSFGQLKRMMGATAGMLRGSRFFAGAKQS